jgi:hypothetical protein
MKKHLKNVSRDELVDFILEYAKDNDKFANAINVRFGEPVYSEELNKIRGQIAHALDDVSDYHYRGSWGYLGVDVSDIITEAKLRAQQGHIKLAFMAMELLYCELLKIFEYQAECEISDIVEADCFPVMLEIAAKAVLPEDKDYIFNQCIAICDYDVGSDYGADYEDKLLQIAVNFVTKDNHDQFEKALSRFDTEWRANEFVAIRLDMIRKLQGRKAADQFIADNLQFEKIREIAFEKAMKKKDYPEAERLCVGGLMAKKSNHWGVSQWLYKLYSVHEKTDNQTKMADTARKILLGGDLAYYDKLKLLLQESETWFKLYPELLTECKSKLPHTQYAVILSKEQESKLLLGEVKAHPTLVYTYGKLLARKYTADISEIFTAQIKKEAAAAYGRDAYQAVCANITIFANAGYSVETIAIIVEFAELYKRKPAFTDELSKIEIAGNPVLPKSKRRK